MSEVLIKENKYCQDCPYRLYQKDDAKIRGGVGNICGNGIIVIEKREYIDILQEIYHSVTSKNILDDYYIISLLDCDMNIHLKYCPTALQKCANNLLNNINEMYINKVIVCGPLYHFLANTGYAFQLLNQNHKVIYINNPGVNYYQNNTAKSTFIYQFMYSLNI